MESDPHKQTADAMGISRAEAKAINFAACYRQSRVHLQHLDVVVLPADAFERIEKANSIAELALKPWGASKGAQLEALLPNGDAPTAENCLKEIHNLLGTQRK